MLGPQKWYLTQLLDAALLYVANRGRVSTSSRAGTDVSFPVDGGAGCFSKLRGEGSMLRDTPGDIPR